MLELEFPEKLLFLIDAPARYKVIYGGRGGLKTETVARALIILATQKKLRIACFRDIQKSIAESVYETLKNCISDLGVSDEFDILATTITSKRTGTEFIFFGLRHNINNIKSLARIDIAWIEEAITVTKTCWDKLEPTIRGKHETDPSGMGGPFGLGPEIWITFNPELDTDETYKRFVLKRDENIPEFIEADVSKEDQSWFKELEHTLSNSEITLSEADTAKFKKIRNERYSIVIKTSYQDNKWLPKDLRQKIAIAKAKEDQSDYLHVYEGYTKQVLDGAIYAEEIKKVLLEGRRGKVKYDPSRPVHTFWDLGHDDYTSIWFVQQIGVEYNLINFFQDRLKKIPFYLEHLQSLKYNYGFHHLPHDADNETLASRSVARIVRDAYPGKVKVVPRVPQKIVGIRAARVVFDLCNFDEENTSEGWQCLCRYQFEVDEDGKFSQKPLHNEFSHGADAYQTFALSLKSETATKKTKRKDVVVYQSGVRGSNSWMGN